jgi:hypothetical protein
MANLNRSSFLDCWQIIRAATAPGPDCARWQAGGVDWRRQRHAFSGDGCSFAIEIHRLAFVRPGAASWSLMVVIEHWWGADKEALKSTSWARCLSGSSAAIFAWARTHEAVRRATAPPSISPISASSRRSRASLR